MGWWTNTPGRATGFSHRWPLNSGDQPSPLLVLSWQACYLLCSLIPFDKEGCGRDSCRVIRIFKLNQTNLLKVPSPMHNYGTVSAAKYCRIRYFGDTCCPCHRLSPVVRCNHVEHVRVRGNQVPYNVSLSPPSGHLSGSTTRLLVL